MMHLSQIVSVGFAIFCVVNKNRPEVADIYIWIIELINRYLLVPVLYYLLFRMKSVQIYYEAIEYNETAERTE